MLYTRREIGKLALGAVPAMAGIGATAPSSKFNGVQIGAITYSYRGIDKIDDVIAALIESGVNEVELMSSSAESEAGAPSGRGEGGRAPGRGAGTPAASGIPATQGRGVGGGNGIRPPMNDEQLAAARNQPRALELKQWRLSAPMSSYQAIGKRFTGAGIDLDRKSVV